MASFCRPTGDLSSPESAGCAFTETGSLRVAGLRNAPLGGGGASACERDSLVEAVGGTRSLPERLSASPPLPKARRRFGPAASIAAALAAVEDGHVGCADCHDEHDRLDDEPR